jgi:hypothetical protein
MPFARGCEAHLVFVDGKEADASQKGRCDVGWARSHSKALSAVVELTVEKVCSSLQVDAPAKSLIQCSLEIRHLIS